MLKSKVLALAATAALTAGLAGCSQDSADAAGGKDTPVVLTTFTVIQDIASNVAGDHLRVESITKPLSLIHI